MGNPAVDYPVNAYCQITDIANAYEGFTVPAAYTANSNLELQRAIIESTHRIESICSAYFGKATLNFEFSGNGTPHAWLAEITSLNILSITSIKYRDTYTASYDWANGETVDADTYGRSDSGASLVRIGYVSGSERRNAGIGGVWIKGYKNYRLTGVFGRQEIPLPIEMACVFLVRERIQPGYTKRSEPFLRERWPDNYEYERTGRFLNSVPSYTGYDGVDRLLHPFVEHNPGLGFAVV